MVRKYLFLLAALSLLIVPAMAVSGVDNSGNTIDNLTLISTLYSETEELNYYDISGPIVFNQAAEGYVVSHFEIDVEANQGGTFYIHLNDGGTVITGTFNYGASYAGFIENFYISLDAANKTYGGLSPVFRTQNLWITYMVADAGTASQQYYIAMYRSDWFVVEGDVLLYPISSPADNPIVQVDFTPTSSVPKIAFGISSWQALAEAETNAESLVENVVSWVKSLFGSIWALLLLLWGIFSFFFIENLLLMILIIEGTILAYRFNTSKNVFLALSRTASDNQRLLTGIIGFIQMVVGFLWDLASLINPMRWIFGK